MQPLSERVTRKDAFIPLSMLGCVINSSDEDEKIVKALDEIQDCIRFIKKLFEAKID
jgi:hypothetical protein